MSELLAILIVATLLIAALGFYRGWFQVNRQVPVLGGNKINYNVTIDPDKMKADAKSVERKAGLSEPDLRKD